MLRALRRGVIDDFKLTPRDVGLFSVTCGFDAHIYVRFAVCLLWACYGIGVGTVLPHLHARGKSVTFYPRLRARLQQVMPALASGGCLAIASPDGHTDPAYMAAFLRRHRVSWFLTVPTLAALYLEALQGQPCDSMRFIITGGGWWLAVLQALMGAWVRR